MFAPVSCHTVSDAVLGSPWGIICTISTCPACPRVEQRVREVIIVPSAVAELAGSSGSKEHCRRLAEHLRNPIAGHLLPLPKFRCLHPLERMCQRHPVALFFSSLVVLEDTQEFVMIPIPAVVSAYEPVTA